MSEKKPSRLGKYTRRGFLGLGLLTGGALAVGYYYYRKPYPNPLLAEADKGEATFNPYVKIAPDNTVTIIAPRAEMGQGVQTTLAALVAEELEVPLADVQVEHGPASSAYYNQAMLEEGVPFALYDEGFMANSMRSTMGVLGKFFGLQVTGGSSAMTDAYDKMRKAGCAARMTLLAAAAQQWNTDRANLEAKDGFIINSATGDKRAYGELAATAATIDPPSELVLKPREKWTQLGKSQPRSETIEKVTGAPIFGIDVQLDDMLYGTVVMSPRFGAGATAADKDAARAVSGVIDVINIDTHTGKGFGIIAENTWAAFQGAAALAPEWEEAPYPADTDGMIARLDDALNNEAAFSMGGSGDTELAFADAAAEKVLEAEYFAPNLAHATMEPMNATARLADGRLDIWTGTQAPGVAEMHCAERVGLEAENVHVHTTFLGGGFGRRSEADFAIYAAEMARHTKGRPIKVTWTREEDTQHDAYRPIAKIKMRAKVGEEGIDALEGRVASPPLAKNALKRLFPAISPAGPDKTLVDGMFNQPYAIPDSKFEAHIADISVPIGFWRSVGNSFNGFFLEGFIDEAAHQAGRDPVEFRLAMMSDERFKPARAVLKKAAEMADWGSPLPEGRARGVAHVVSFGTWVAEVIEVEIQDGAVKIDKVFCAADPGLVLDPDNFKAQMMSGIVYGLSAATREEITFADGMVEQSNFHDYDPMRMAQCPEIHVELLENWHHLGGAGEPGTPPAAPALANAIFAATGKRIRRMPMSHEIDFV